MKRPDWFERKFEFGYAPEMLPFFLERLAGTLVRLEDRVSTLPPELLTLQPGGKWSIQQHIGHLAEVDEIALRRIGEMLDGVSPMSPAVFEPKDDYNAQSLREVINKFRTCRRRCLDRYATLTERELAASSLHPRLKTPMSPVDLAAFDADHDDHHLLKIADIRERWLKENKGQHVNRKK